MKLDKTKYEDDEMDQQKEEEERLLIVMVTDQHQTSLLYILNIIRAISSVGFAFHAVVFRGLVFVGRK